MEAMGTIIIGRADGRRLEALPMGNGSDRLTVSAEVAHANPTIQAGRLCVGSGCENEDGGQAAEKYVLLHVYLMPNQFLSEKFRAEFRKGHVFMPSSA
jgi:hypothetical protein